MPAEIQETLASSLAWIALVSALFLAGIAVLLHQILGRMRAMEERFGALDRLVEIQTELARIERDQGGSDLSQLEGVLVDLRDAQRRLAERLIDIAETGHREQARGESDSQPGAPANAERIVNRLLAMGYERLQLITPNSEIDAAFRDGGEVIVEARRDGVACKGRVRIENGRIADAELRSAHSMFP